MRIHISTNLNSKTILGIFLFLSFFILTSTTYAQPFAPGTELNPSCLPTSATCIVDTIYYGNEVTGGTANEILYINSTGDLDSDSAFNITSSTFEAERTVTAGYTSRVVLENLSVTGLGTSFPGAALEHRNAAGDQAYVASVTAGGPVAALGYISVAGTTRTTLSVLSSGIFLGYVTSGVDFSLDLDSSGLTFTNDTSGDSYVFPTDNGLAGQYLQTNGSGTLSWQSLSSSISSLTAANATNTIGNGNYAQEWQWNTLTSNTGLTLSSNSTTASTSTQKVFAVSTAGANANPSETTYAASFVNTHTGTTSTNVAGYFSASGATNNYALIVPSGYVGIGTANPLASTQVSIFGTGSTSSTYGLQVHNSTGTNNALVVRDDGFVGIGTSSPAQLFQVGDATVDATRRTRLAGYNGSNVTFIDQYVSGNTKAIVFDNGSGADGLVLRNLGATPNTLSLAGAGTNPVAVFDLRGGTSGNAFLSLQAGGASDASALYLYRGLTNTIRLIDNNLDDSYINTGQDFGVGTSSPSYRLDVSNTDSGAVYPFNISMQGSQYMRVGSSSSTNKFIVFDGGSLIRPASNGSTVFKWELVPQGTQTSSVIDLNNASDQTRAWLQGSSGGGYLALYNAAGTETVRLIDNGVNASYINTGFNFGIGDTTPDYKLDIDADVASYAQGIFNDGNNDNRLGLLIQTGADTPSAAKFIQFNDGDGGDVGSICYTGGQANICAPSDERLKENIADTLIGLDDLMSIKVRDFSYIADEEQRIFHGFVAQELYEIYPSAVSKPSDPNEYWKVSYGQLTPLIVKSVQELKLSIDDISNFTNNLENSSFAGKLREFLANGANRITRIFTGEICLYEEGQESECINREELKQLKGLLNGSNNTSSPSPSPEPEPEPEPEPSPEPSVEPEPENVPEENTEVVPEETIEEEQNEEIPQEDPEVIPEEEVEEEIPDNIVIEEVPEIIPESTTEEQPL